MITNCLSPLRTRCAIVGASAAIALVPVTAGSSSAAPIRSVPAHSAQAGAIRWTPALATAAMRTGHSRLGEVAPADSGYELEQQADLTPVRRLGSSGPRMVLDTRQVGGLSDVARTYGVTARVAATGRAMWSRTFAEPIGGYAAVLPEVIGSTSNHGLLESDAYSVPGSVSGTQDSILRLRAIAGATGKVLWTKTFTGTHDNSGPSTSDLPLFAGVLPRTASGVPSYLVDLESYAADEYTSQAVIVSGVNGQAETFGPSYTTTAGSPAFQPIPDANGDRISDVVVDLPGSGGYVRAMSAATDLGPTIWTYDSPTIVNTQSTTSIGSFGGRPCLVVMTDYLTHGTITVITLRAGQVVWSRMGDGFIPVRKAGKSRVDAVFIYRDVSTVSPSTVTDRIDYAAISAAATTLYSRAVSLAISPPSGSSGSATSYEFGPAGDVQPDGSVDIWVSLSASSDAPAKSVSKMLTGIINGRLGHFTAIRFKVPANGSLHHGSGADLLTSAVVHGHPQLTALRGTTGKRLYRRTYAEFKGWQTVYVAGAHATGHSCSDLAMTVESSSHGLSALLDGRGDPLWFVKFKASAPTGGTVTRPKPPREYCP